MDTTRTTVHFSLCKQWSVQDEDMEELPETMIQLKRDNMCTHYLKTRVTDCLCRLTRESREEGRFEGYL